MCRCFGLARFRRRDAQITEILQPFHGLKSRAGSVPRRPRRTSPGRHSRRNDRTLQQDQAQFAAWGAALEPGGDILLYGCDVAQGSVGAQFVQDLAQVTGVEVAANTQATGTAALGGDWNLDYSTGPIQATQLFTAAADSSYGSTLGLGADLQSTINSALAANTKNFTETLPSTGTSSYSLGGFLELDSATLTITANTSNSGTSWTGSVSITAGSITLFPAGGTTFPGSTV